MRLILAIRCFFNLLFRGELSPRALIDLKLVRKGPVAAPPKAAPSPPPAARTSDGALQILSILQRDSRLVDFLMEDISAYPDDQVGAAVRDLHDQCRDSMTQYVKLRPVIDGVEGTFTKTPEGDPGLIRFIGNVPARPPEGGVLRHKGWRASMVDFPALSPKLDATIIAPAEIEIE